LREKLIAIFLNEVVYVFGPNTDVFSKQFSILVWSCQKSKTKGVTAGWAYGWDGKSSSAYNILVEKSLAKDILEDLEKDMRLALR
jgi:hypothetical protein